VSNEGNVHTLEITTTLATDAGRYGCIAENSVGQAKCQCSMKVEEISDEEHNHKDFRALLKSRPSLQEKLSQDSEDSEDKEIEQHDFREVLTSHVEPQLKKKPGFVTHLVDQVAKEGSEVVFEVEIEGVPEPTIEWKCNKKIIKVRIIINPLRAEVYFCHQNQNAKNIGYFTTPLKPHHIGTHSKGIETSFQMVPLFFKSFHV
jgi:hypothetical protein